MSDKMSSDAVNVGNCECGRTFHFTIGEFCRCGCGRIYLGKYVRELPSPDLIGDLGTHNFLGRAVQVLYAERDEARDWVNRMLKARTTTCVYCGHEYPPGTPASGSDQRSLTEHIKVCPKHPMREAEELLRKCEGALRYAYESHHFFHTENLAQLLTDLQKYLGMS